MSTPVFVYGSLLSGLHNHPMAEPALLEAPLKARTADKAGNHFKLYSNHGASFPYLARAEDGVVQGEVLHMQNGPHLDRITGMEVGAGYDPEVIEVEVQAPTGDWVLMRALGYIHREDCKSARGELVADGDWRKYHAEHGFDWSAWVRTPRSTPSRFAN